MAVAGKSGVFSKYVSSTVAYGYLHFYWEETVDEEANQSIFKLTDYTWMPVLIDSDALTLVTTAYIKQTGIPIEGTIKTDTKTTYLVDGVTYTTESASVGETQTISNFSPASAVVYHNADGSITGSCTVYISVTISGGTAGILTTDVSGSFTPDFTDIVRRSSLVIGSTILGSDASLTVTKPEDDELFTHTVTYSVSGSSGTICEASSETSLSFTPSLDLASYYTTTTSVPITFSIQTYYNGVANGDPITSTVYFTMPDSVKPSCSVQVTDKSGLTDIYGGYVKTLSYFDVVITPTIAYGSPIKTYRSNANGNVYTVAEYTTETVNTSGTQTITATVTDARGRVSDTASVSVTVLDYSRPAVTALAVRRCDADGTENNNGTYVEVTFSATVTALSNLNTATYTLNYKKGSETDWTSVALDDLNNQYTVSDYTYIFAADEASSYNVEIALSDRHINTTASTSASTGFCIMHFNAAGNGMAIGKASERAALDIGMDMYDKFGTLIGNGLATYNTSVDPNTTLEHIIITNVNTPTSDVWYILTLFCNDKTTVSNRAQIAIPYNTANTIHNRYFNSDAWSDWN